jgi:hypothetical protein
MLVNWFDITKRTFTTFNTKSVSITTAYRYKGDFFGLLLKELNIPEEHIIPNMIINGYNSSSEYDGTKTDILVIPSDRLKPYT